MKRWVVWIRERSGRGWRWWPETFDDEELEEAIDYLADGGGVLMKVVAWSALPDEAAQGTMLNGHPAPGGGPYGPQSPGGLASARGGAAAAGEE